MTIISNIFTCLPVLLALTNMQIHPLKGWKKYSVYAIFMLGYAFLFPSISAYIIPVNLIGAWILFAVFDKEHAVVNAVSSSLGWAVSVVLDYVLVLLLPLFNISVMDLMTNTKSIQYIVFCALLSVVIYAATYYLGKYFRYLYIDKFKIDTLHSKIKRALILDIVIEVLIILLGNMYIHHYNLGIRAIFITGILYLAQLIIMICIAYQIYSIAQKETVLKMEYQYAKQYSDQLEISNEGYRTDKHDFENTLNSLAYYLDNALYDEANRWLQEHIMPSHKASSELKDKALAMLTNISVSEVKSIFYAGIIKAINAGISVNLFIPESIDTINMVPYDLMRIMGIFLDNAIEGALETDNRYMYSSLKYDDLTKKVYIEIQNATNLTELPKGSTKGSGHGIGLLNAENILKKYQNANLVTNIIDGKFVQSLSIG